MKKTDNPEIIHTINRIYPDVVKLRRAIHAHPELSGKEIKTAALVRKELTRLGIPSKFYLKKTGVRGIIKNGPGKTVVLRADMDALPIGEKTGLPFSSKVLGVMHACGHDLHTALLLGAAGALLELRDTWRGTVVLLFQPSEEMEPGGARGFIGAGAFPENAAGVFGLHASVDHTTGQVGIIAGPDYAGVLNFTVTVLGRGGHAAVPQDTVNPIASAAAMVSELQRLTDIASGAVLSIGTITSGTRSNIVPDEAVFTGTIRTHLRLTEKRMEQQVRRIVALTAKASGARARVSFEKSYPPTFNDPGLTKRFSDCFAKMAGDGVVVRRKNPIFYAEDFAYYQQKASGLFIHLGVRTPSIKKALTVPGLHSSRFSPDETAMKIGMTAHVAFVVEMLSAGQ